MKEPVRVIDEQTFNARLREVLSSTDLSHVGAVTGPGRSGAVAAVYASHIRSAAGFSNVQAFA
jgi:hypothetical protein